RRRAETQERVSVDLRGEASRLDEEFARPVWRVLAAHLFLDVEHVSCRRGSRGEGCDDDAVVGGGEDALLLTAGEGTRAQQVGHRRAVTGREPLLRDGFDLRIDSGRRARVLLDDDAGAACE